MNVRFGIRIYLQAAAFLLWLAITGGRLQAQVPGCGATVPYELINLTGNPDSVWISAPTVRQGLCCGVSNPIRCISYEIILDPDAAGIVMSSSEGALPPGSYFYQVGCGPTHYLDSVICLTGVGPHYITFCKPGGNTNIYQIASIGKPTFPADDSTRIGCYKKITTYGLVPSTVTWNSIYPGNPSDYNHYLSATSNATSVTFAPTTGAPPYIDYEICGQPSADECGYILYTCDTVRMYVKQALGVTVSPNPANFCASGSGVLLTATAFGGDGNYTYEWKNPLGTVVGTGASVTATLAGNYVVTVNDGMSGATCAGVNLTVPVTITSNPTADAGSGPDGVSSGPRGDAGRHHHQCSGRLVDGRGRRILPERHLHRCHLHAHRAGNRRRLRHTHPLHGHERCVHGRGKQHDHLLWRYIGCDHSTAIPFLLRRQHNLDG